MFERFTNRARQAIVLAQEEARRLDHDFIGTEHVLLGLLGQADSVAGRALSALGITLPAVRADVEALIGRGSASATGHIPFTARAKKVLELSLREALAMGHNYIGTEHIILGIVRDGEGVATRVLAERGATAERVRAEVVAELGRVAGGRAVATESARRTPGAEAVIVTAEELAGGGPVGSHHLLEAMALVDDSLAAAALQALGVGPEALAAKISQLGTDGTSDVSPDDAAARRAEVRVGEDEVTVVLRDPAALQVGAALAGALGNTIGGDVPTGSPLVGLWRANLAELRRLADLVAVRDEPEPQSRAAQVRAAIRNRLRRRSA